MVQEDFLHFVWQHQYFNSSHLFTTEGKSLEVFKTGFHNELAGPDFKEARLKIDGLLWTGSIEIHLKSSDWLAHQHSGDPNYENVILHVVYEHNQEVLDEEGRTIPTLALKGLIKPGILSRYKTILNSQSEIYCSDLFPKVRAVTRLAMLESALVRRLQRKGELFKKVLERNNNDWEQSTFEWVARGFGFKTNAESMSELAVTVPLKVLLKHDSRMQWEALLYGASGLLNSDHHDEYADLLRREYAFLERKYNIRSSLTYNQWHFSGVRPSSFPTLRIAQFTALVHTHRSLFSLFTQFDSIKDLEKLLQLEQSEYWQIHLNFGKVAKSPSKALSKTAVQNLLINVVAPLLVAYAIYKSNNNMLDKAMSVLMALPVEDNHIIRKWQGLGWNVNSGFDTQGLIELFNEYCIQKKCLKCKIGAELVKA